MFNKLTDLNRPVYTVNIAGTEVQTITNELVPLFYFLKANNGLRSSVEGQDCESS